ncbi:MAG TPA: type IV pilus modification protein PilV [Vicinamibacterales bacterium]|nr:type IV pilus modification protein PilV [Vicinamibacterales bacterium]
MSARRPVFANRPALRGFTIVEALVALVVLAVGMLGIASLYVTTLRASGSASSRMQAINLASDLGDRIRANRTAEDAYAGAAAADGTTCLGAAATCTAAQMAAHDLFVWQAAIQAVLPGAPAGVVTVDTDTNPTSYRIEVSWVEAGETTPQSYTLNMQI